MKISQLPTSRFYSLELTQKPKTTSIFMSLFTSETYTSSLPTCFPYLQQILPSIFKSSCFNSGYLPFSIEAKETEIGHLFEHIVLEYLCLEKLKLGFKSADYQALTTWNWYQNPIGTFKIDFQLNSNQIFLFLSSVSQSVKLLDKILETSNISPLNHKQRQPLFKAASAYSFLTIPSSSSLDRL